MANSAWFTRDRFGLFIHWGLYSLAARHEWVANFEKIPAAEYEKYGRYFDADLFDPERWIAQANAAGTRYVVLTTKHHEGFCLWDSKLTDYTVMNTPLGTDVVAKFLEAARAAGLKVGLYHSLIDWHHPHFPVDGLSPERDDENVEEINADRRIERYRAYLHGQVRELLTNYGTIDYLFFDFSYGHGFPLDVWGSKGSEEWGAEDLMRLAKDLQPNILVNDRLGIEGDFVTPEQYQPAEPFTSSDGHELPWEACQTINGSWGYFRDKSDNKSADLLIRMLIDGVSKGGNLLLNVGPNGRGEFDGTASQILADIGEWMRLHSRSIYGAGRARYQAPTDVRFTQRGDRLYVHLFAWPFEALHLPGLGGHVEYAQLLNDASEIKYEVSDPTVPASLTRPAGAAADTLILKLPVRRPQVAVPVIEIFLR